MKRNEILTLMQAQVNRMTELGQVVQLAVGATAFTADDLGALTTAADVVTGLADQFKAAVTGAVGKESRAAGEFEKALRRWSMGVRLLADGLGERSQRLLAMGRQHYNDGAEGLNRAIGTLAG